jgi:hypothetical protein
MIEGCGEAKDAAVTGDELLVAQANDSAGWLWTGLIGRISQDQRSRGRSEAAVGQRDKPSETSSSPNII